LRNLLEFQQYVVLLSHAFEIFIVKMSETIKRIPDELNAPSLLFFESQKRPAILRDDDQIAVFLFHLADMPGIMLHPKPTALGRQGLESPVSISQ